jgi:hypothetical protein
MRHAPPPALRRCFDLRFSASGLYRIAYCSRSCLIGAPAEIGVQIRRILATARVSNPEHDLTGVLTFDQSYFAQVLEDAADDLA